VVDFPKVENGALQIPRDCETILIGTR